MEFWGIEVKAGQTTKVLPDEDQVIHISQASLGESKKGKSVDSVPLFVKFGEQKLVLGTLSSEKFPQISFDLVFEKEFELSHNWTGGSVYFMGYKSVLGDEDEEHSDFDSDEDVPIQFGANGSAELASVPAAEIKAKAAKKSEDSEEDNSDSEDVSDDEALSGDSDEDDDDSEEEDTPKKPEVGKKRANEVAAKSQDNKKAKLATPSKTDVKKEVHIATPHPKKQGKTPGGNKTQSPKSGGSVSCKSCSKTFNSEVGLQSHAKAKHSGGK